MPGGKISYSECIAFYNVRPSLSPCPLLSSRAELTFVVVVVVQVIHEMDLVEKVVREACARSPDGKITPLDFVNHASRTMRYGTFSPMEVAIIFHFSRQGVSDADKPRLGLRDFGSLLDAKWGPPRSTTTVTEGGKVKRKAGSAMHEIGKVRPLPLSLEPLPPALERLELTLCPSPSATVGVLLWARRHRWRAGRDGRCVLPPPSL